MSEALDRRLVAVMFTDMVGYTALRTRTSASVSANATGTGRRSIASRTRSVGRLSSGSGMAA